MSRGPSPAFAMNATGSFSMTPASLPTPIPPVHPPRSTLRVNTDPSLTRLRSNSAQSSLPSASFPHGPDPSHHPSRSLSHAPLSPVYSEGSRSSQSTGPFITFDGSQPMSAGASRISPPVSASTGMMRINKALESSPDEGETLDLSRQGIDRIGDDEVEVFRKGVGRDRRGVWRLALSYNALRNDSVSRSFSRLTRLRYLNLKGNQFTAFPVAITEMVALEILDLSKNAISAFPDVPGRLSQLKVLSLTNNHIYTLPSYLTTFSQLKVFKVDQNPIEWPPREVLGPLVDHESKKSDTASISTARSEKSRKDEDLRPWIENMKSWMRLKVAETERLLDQSRADKLAESEPTSAVSIDSMDSAPWARRIAPLLAAAAPDSENPPHSASSYSRRNRAATISEDSLVHTASLSQSSVSHDRSISSSSATSPFGSAHSRTPSGGIPPPVPTGHARGSSYTATQRYSANLTAKKSLPDLRQSHAKIIADRRSGEKQLEDGRAGFSLAGSRLRMTEPPPEDRRLSRKISEEVLKRKDTKADSVEPQVDESRNSYFRRLSTLPVSTISNTIPPALLNFLDATRGILFALSQLHSALKQYLVFAVNERVAGVFTRVMEPASSYMMNLINALDRFDSMSRRGTPPIQAIQGVIDATKESVAVFGKVIAVLKLQMPALRGGDVRYTRTLLTMVYGSMAEVACSWKTMAALIPDLKPVLADPVSAMGGHKMVPTGSLTGRTPISPIPERGESHSPPSVPRSSAKAAASPLHDVEETPVPSPLSGRIRRQAGSFSTQDVEKGMMMGSPGGPSSELGRQNLVLMEDMDEESDEEIMPPNPPFARNAGAASVPSTPPNASIDMATTSSQHSRRGHKQQSSSGSSHALSMSGAPLPFRKLSIDVRPPTPASATLFDDDLLDLMENTTDIAFGVWLKLAEDIGGTFSHSKSSSQDSSSSYTPISRKPIPSQSHQELLVVLSASEQTTSTLRESIMGLRANPHTYNTTTFPDDAQSFIKTVIKVSELVKAISSNHVFPTSVRQSLSKLTQATRECAILISVSSLRPGASTPVAVPPSARSFSPAPFHGSSNLGSNVQSAVSSAEELYVPPLSAGFSPGWNQRDGLRGLQLPSRQMALGRSRSANAVPPVEISVGGVYHQHVKSTGGDPPRSAQPSQIAF